MYFTRRSRQRSRSSPPPKDPEKTPFKHADHCKTKLNIPAFESFQRSRSHHRNVLPKTSTIYCDNLPCHILGGSCNDIVQAKAKAFEFGNFLVQISEILRQTTVAEGVVRVAEERAKPAKPPDKEALPPVERSKDREAFTASGSHDQDHRHECANPLSPSSSASSIPVISVEQPSSAGSECPDNSPPSITSSSLGCEEGLEKQNTDGDRAIIESSGDDSSSECLRAFPCLLDHDSCSPATPGESTPISDCSGRRRSSQQFYQFSANAPAAQSHAPGLGHAAPVHMPGSGQSNEGSGNNGGRRPMNRDGRRRLGQHGKFHCVYLHSGRNDETSDCHTRKPYVSQLRRHHDRHGFFYCTKCFSSDFRTQNGRDTHISTCLLTRCVTENCHNFDLFLQLLGADALPCGHGNTSSGRDQWRYLFKLARPGDAVPEPEPQLELPENFIPLSDNATPRDAMDSGASAGMDMASSDNMNPIDDSQTLQEPAIARLAREAQTLVEISQHLSSHARLLNSHENLSIEQILDHVQTSVRHLRQLQGRFNQRRHTENDLQASSPDIRVPDVSPGLSPVVEQPPATPPMLEPAWAPANNDIAQQQPESTYRNHAVPGLTFTPSGFAPRPTPSQPSMQVQYQEGPFGRDFISESEAVANFHLRPQIQTYAYRVADPQASLRNAMAARASITNRPPQTNDDVGHNHTWAMRPSVANRSFIRNDDQDHDDAR